MTTAADVLAALLLELLRREDVRAALREAMDVRPPLATEKPVLYATVKQYAERQHVSARTVERWVRTGLPSYRHGKVRRIPVADADAWLREGGHVIVSQRRTYRRRPRAE